MVHSMVPSVSKHSMNGTHYEYYFATLVSQGQEDLESGLHLPLTRMLLCNLSASLVLSHAK
jgi:hypothetical protein